MLEPWNDESIRPPPVHTTCQPAVSFDIEDVRYICKEASKILGSQSPLHKEGAVLSRLLYKFDKKFRNDIGYRSLKKVNTALRKYLTLNLLNIVEQFCAVLPPSDYDDPSLPTRQMLEYLLVRTITFAKLMLRTCVCAKQAAVFYLDRVKRGEGHWMSLMPYAVVSRIWSMTSILLTYACNWYNYLHTFLDKLQLKGLLFLPGNYNLPKDLIEWLEVKRLDDYGRYNWKENKCIEMIQILDDIDEPDGFDIFKYVNEINEPDMKEIEVDRVTESLQTFKAVEGQHVFKSPHNMDQGEAVSRESFQVLSIGHKAQHLPKIFEPKKIKHSTACVTNSDTLKQFLATEEKYRNEGSEDALSGHLSFMQWQALKSTLVKLANTLAKSSKVKKTFQKIWKEKCLDYCEVPN